MSQDNDISNTLCIEEIDTLKLISALEDAQSSISEESDFLLWLPSINDINPDKKKKSKNVKSILQETTQGLDQLIQEIKQWAKTYKINDQLFYVDSKSENDWQTVLKNKDWKIKIINTTDLLNIKQTKNSIKEEEELSLPEKIQLINRAWDHRSDMMDLCSTWEDLGWKKYWIYKFKVHGKRGLNKYRYSISYIEKSERSRCIISSRGSVSKSIVKTLLAEIQAGEIY